MVSISPRYFYSSVYINSTMQKIYRNIYFRIFWLNPLWVNVV